jgi:hypothetical protein
MAVLLFAPTPSQAVTAPLPSSVQQQLQAPNADVVAIALAAAQSNFAVATAALQAPINILGGNSLAAANAMMSFADKAKSLVPQGPNHNAAAAAALAVAVRNAYYDPQNAALVSGEWAAICAAALAEANEVLEDAEVQQALLEQETLQAAAGGGGFGFGGGLGGGTGGGGGGSPTR